MIDLLQVLFRFILDTAIIFPSVFGRATPIITVLFVILLVCALRPNLGGGEERKIERGWSDVCSVILGRLNKLLPLYQRTNVQYIQAQASLLTNDQNVVQSVCSIANDVKETCEKEYCLHDVDEPEQLAVLHAQLSRLIGQKEK